MKTAVSIPDELFERAERTAARLGWNRSQLYARAIDEFLSDEEKDDPVTAALDRLASEDETPPPFNAGKALIDAGLWEW